MEQRKKFENLISEITPEINKIMSIQAQSGIDEMCIGIYYADDCVKCKVDSITDGVSYKAETSLKFDYQPWKVEEHR